MSRAAMLLAVALAATPRAAEGQSQTDRQALVAFRDSVSAVTDPAALTQLAVQYEDMHDSGPEAALARIRGGYLRLLSREPADAQRDFQEASKLQPGWPTPWVGLGDAHYALGLRTRGNTQNLGTVPGLGEFRRAAKAYYSALALDPHFTPAVEAELRLASERRDTALLATALDHARLLPSVSSTSSFKFELSRAAWQLGGLPLAAEALQSVPPSDRTPSIQYQLARVTLAEGDAYGEVYYWSAVALDDAAMLSVLRRDMALIATPIELTEFDTATPGPSRVAFLHRFWDHRDSYDLRSPGERLQEHYARIAYADSHFSFDEVRHMFKPGDLRASGQDTTLDSRGVVYVRMGAPDILVHTPFCGYVDNESWAYDRPDGELLLHFASQNSIGDHVMIQGVEDINYLTTSWFYGLGIPPSAQEVMGRVIDSRVGGGCGNNLFGLMAARQGISPLYSKLLSASGNAGERYVQELAALSRKSIVTSTHTDAYPLRFPASVMVQLLPLLIGAAPHGSGIQIAVWVVHPKSGRTSRPDTLRVRFGAFDSTGTVLTHFDSTLVYRGKPSANPTDTSETVFARFETSLPAGDWTWKAAVQSGDSTGALFASHQITVPIHDSSTLAVSDLVLGTPGWAARWLPAPQDTAWITPRSTLRASQAASLYYEVYGLPAGAPYRTEVTVRQGNRKSRPGITVGFTETSQGTPTRLSRTLDLRPLAPGDYVLEVKVTDATGESAISTRPMVIVEENVSP